MHEQWLLVGGPFDEESLFVESGRKEVELVYSHAGAEIQRYRRETIVVGRKEYRLGVHISVDWNSLNLNELFAKIVKCNIEPIS